LRNVRLRLVGTALRETVIALPPFTARPGDETVQDVAAGRSSCSKQ
jgi:hypothetical protein